MRNVIRTGQLEEHSIEPYRFRVLGSKDQTPPVSQQEIVEPSIKEEPQAATNTNNIHSEEPVRSTQTLESGFVEELLKKTDELSSNIIKLQMQIENQEAEFEKRLHDELIRTKENAFKEGVEKGRQEVEASLNELKAQVGRSLHILEEEHHRFKAFIEHTEKELSGAAIDVAKEVIKKEITTHSTDVAIALSRALMKELVDASFLELKVNPRDYEGVKQSIGSLENIKVGTDDAIAPGGVIILSDAGNLDGSIATRLEKIRHVMRD